MPAARGMSVIIVGAGFGGIAAAIELRRHGFRDVTLLERASSLGGTWHYNDYPGCACDVPSHLYSFSFAQRRHWSRLCSPRAEILAYLEEVAQEYGVDRLVRFGTDVTACRWHEESLRWTVGRGRAELGGGRGVVATGQLHQPAIPSIPGRFEGRAFTPRGGTTTTICAASVWR